jgi:hypothetical protein
MLLNCEVHAAKDLLVSGTEPFVLTFQTRNSADSILVKSKKMEGSQVAIIVMDMWDRSGCDSITEQINTLIGPMNKTLAVARQLGISVVFSPSEVTEFYKDLPQREVMKELPNHTLTMSQYNPRMPSWMDQNDLGCTKEKTGKLNKPWKRQHMALDIDPRDYITENTKELFNLCREKGITTLLFMGVGTNMNLLNRPTGIIAMTKAGLECAVVRDLSIGWEGNELNLDDSNPNFDKSIERKSGDMIPFMEKFIAPTVSANQLFIAADIEGDLYKRDYGKPLFSKEEVKNYLPIGPTQRFRHLCYDYNWVGRTLTDIPKKFSKASAVEYAEFSKKMNLDAALVLSVPHQGYTTYNSELGVRFPALDTDWFGEVVQELHKRDISAFGYITVGTNWKFMRDHIGKDYIHGELNEDGMMDMRGLCLNAPGYLDMLTDYTKEVLENYPVDAIRYDMFFTPKYCSCNGCKEYYAEIYNENFTTWDDILKKEPKRQDLFNLKTLSRVAHRINETGMAIKPSVERWQNHINTYEYADVNLGRLYDVAYIEFGDPFRLLSLRGILNKDAIIVGQTLKSPIRRLIMALGARCYQYVDVDQETVLPAEKELDWFENDLSPFFKMVSEVQPYLENTKLPSDIAVVFSENTRYHLPGLDREPYMKASEGIVMKYLDRSVPVQFINCLDLDLYDLRKYKMIMVPRTSGLTDGELIHLRNYVREGGNLLVTGDALLFDEEGVQRNDFSLSTELGLQYEGMLNDSIQKDIKIKNPKLKRISKENKVQMAGMVKTSPISGNTWASVSLDGQEFPLVHSNVFGKGKMIYVASSASTELIEQVGNIITGKLSVIVSDPKKQVILSHQDDHNRYILHLLGDGDYSISIDKDFANITKGLDMYPVKGWGFDLERTNAGVTIHVSGNAQDRLLILR